MVKVLLEAGAMIDLQSIEQHTALMFAVFGSHVALVKVLLEAGASIDLRDKVFVYFFRLLSHEVDAPSRIDFDLFLFFFLFFLASFYCFFL